MQLITELPSTLDFKESNFQTSLNPAKPTLKQLIDYHHRHIAESEANGTWQQEKANI